MGTEEMLVDGSSDQDVSAPGVQTSLRPGRPRTWVLTLAVFVVLLMCSCVSTVFLVLTGIIAEPETVIEQIGRLLFGG